MSDFNLKITVRSDRIIKAISDSFGTQAEMTRKTGLSSSIINSFVCIREKPFGSKGWTGRAETFAASLGVYPSDLWPDHMREVQLRRATAEFSMDEAEVKALMTDDKSMERRQIINMAMAGLLPKTQLAITMQNNGATLDEIGAVLDVTRERVRQRIYKGMRDMRAKMRANGFRELTDVL